MKKCLHVLSLFFVFLFCSCASVNLENAAHVLAIQYATGKVIEQGPTKPRAAAVIEEVEKAKTFFDFNRYTISEIKQKVLKRLVRRGLTAADMLLAGALIDAVEREINKKIAKGEIYADRLVSTNEVLDLIADTARRYL